MTYVTVKLASSRTSCRKNFPDRTIFRPGKFRKIIKGFSQLENFFIIVWKILSSILKKNFIKISPEFSELFTIFHFLTSCDEKPVFLDFFYEGKSQLGKFWQKWIPEKIWYHPEPEHPLKEPFLSKYKGFIQK